MNIGDKIELVYRGEKVHGEVTEIKPGFVVVTDALGKKYYVATKQFTDEDLP